MKQQPPQDGMAAAESLYSFDKSNSTISNVAHLEDIINVICRPSLIPGVEYPTTDREERLINLAYAKGCADTLRINRAGRVVEDDPLLDYMREEVERIRTEELGYE